MTTPRKIVAIVIACGMIGLLLVASYPKTIVVTNRSETSKSELRVVYGFAGSDSLEMPFDESGSAALGRGFWRSPWQKPLAIVAVFNNEEVFWEGVVTPPLLGQLEIELNEGRPLPAALEN